MLTRNSFPFKPNFSVLSILIISNLSMFCRCSRPHPDRHDDRRQAVPLQAALDGEGGLVVQQAVVELLQAEGELAGEDRGAGILLRHLLAAVDDTFHHVGGQHHAVIGGKTELAGPVPRTFPDRP